MNKKLQFTLLLTLAILLTSISSKAQSNFGELKAAFKAHTHKVYFFTKDKYYRYDLSNKKLENNGQNLSNWKGLPKDFDASLYNPKNGKYYFFKDDTYYKYDFKRGVEYTGKIGKHGWRGLPTNIDAAVVDPTDQGIIHFFKKDKTFIYRHSDGKVIFTSSIAKRWPGVPNNINAALLHANGRIYFFKGNTYYKFNFQTHKVEKTGTVGKEDWRGLSFDTLNHGEDFDYSNHTSGFDAVNYNEEHSDVHFFNKAKVFNIKYIWGAPAKLLQTNYRIEDLWAKKDSKANIGTLGGNWYTGAPRNIDAVIYFEGYYYFFKGNKYYKLHSKSGKIEKGRYIKDRFGNKISNGIDAAVVAGRYIYFFKGDWSFRYDIKSKKINKWVPIKGNFKGVPDPVDAAKYNPIESIITFYSGNRYYNYSIINKKVIRSGIIPSKYLKIK